MASFTDLHVREYELPPSLSYRGRYVHNWFSNFDPCGHPVEYRGYRSQRLEIPFVAAKNPDVMVPAPGGRGMVPFIERVFACSRPGEAKRLGAPRYRGGIIDPRPDWDEVNLAAMDFFLRQRWQPGTDDVIRLAGLPRPIVEWNNWRDDRWGVSIGKRRGRNGLGLLLEVIAEEYQEGQVASGADEAFWFERQEELVAMLNQRSPETVVQLVHASAPHQLDLFR